VVHLSLISGLRPNPYDVLDEATLNAALAVISSFGPKSELEAFLATQAVIAGFSALRMMDLSQRHLGEENIAVYGTFAGKLLRIQSELIETLSPPPREQPDGKRQPCPHPSRREGGGRTCKCRQRRCRGEETKIDGQPHASH
jgi:hypothetical protein